MDKFKLVTQYQPTGDQPQAIKKLVAGLDDGKKEQTLLGVTGSGKTFTMANIVAQKQKPTLVLCHNKTLAAQLYSEFKQFFPEAEVHYFVSYFDYYQPEAYIASSDVYIEKDSKINEEIDRLRHAATSALLTRRDTLIVASVSCIYGIGSVEDYGQMAITLKKGERRQQDKLLRHLSDIQYQRNDIDFHRSTFRVRGDVVDIFPAGSETAYRVEFFGDEIERMTRIDPLTGEIIKEMDVVTVFPGSHYVTPREKLAVAIEKIRKESEDAVVSAILTLSVLNQTPIYGVMGFLMDGEALAGFAEFPEKTRARLQMTPSFASIITIFDKEVLPRLLDFLT